MTVETVEYRVRRGDTFQNIVEAAGFPRRDWGRIYNAPYNRAIKKLRPDPDHIEPGDRIMLPRFNPQQIADIAQRIQAVDNRFGRLTDAARQVERGISELEEQVQSSRAQSERDQRRKIEDLERRSDDLLDIAASAADLCDDAYSCMGGGAVSAKFEATARKLRNEAKQVQRHVSRDERAALKALKNLRSRLSYFQREYKRIENEMISLRNYYRRAARNPY